MARRQQQRAALVTLEFVFLEKALTDGGVVIPAGDRLRGGYARRRPASIRIRRRTARRLASSRAGLNPGGSRPRRSARFTQTVAECRVVCVGPRARHSQRRVFFRHRAKLGQRRSDIHPCRSLLYTNAECAGKAASNDAGHRALQTVWMKIRCNQPIFTFARAIPERNGTVNRTGGKVHGLAQLEFMSDERNYRLGRSRSQSFRVGARHHHRLVGVEP